MAMSGYLEEPFDMCEGLFDNIEDILDFSNSDNVLMGMVDSCVDGGQQLAPPPPPPVPATAFPCSSEKDGSVLTGVSEEVDKIVSADELTEMCDELNITEDWLSNFLDDTEFSLDLPATAAISVPDLDRAIKDDSLFRSASPVSVLEQSNLSGGGGAESGISISSSSSNNVHNDVDIISLLAVSTPGPVACPIPARARTKRPRPVALSQCVAVPIVEPERDIVTVPTKKKKVRATSSELEPAATAPRKCLHCGIQKTPQWRAGPMGPKTLCNACGVRYKSGRLFPEYRPAASPTFVPSVHSNSHKRVVEMRIKATAKDTYANATSTAAKNCDLLLYIKRKE